MPHSFYKRWKHSEQRLSESQGFTLEEVQLRQDWEVMVALADQTGRALEQIHVFALAHILRRPIIVYGVRLVKNYRGENLGYANFEGNLFLLYLYPLICCSNRCVIFVSTHMLHLTDVLYLYPLICCI